jgi:ribosomal protein S24E
MKLEIINQKENPLFKRKEIEAEVEAEVTPNKREIQKLISEKFSTAPEAVKIKGIHGKFGSKLFRIEANVYSSAEDKEKTEPKIKKKIEAESRTKGSAPPMDKEQPAEQAPAPVETPKEEPKQEVAPIEQKPEEPKENKE